MRIGIYGGSFDPIHYGHLLLAEICRESLSLEQVIFIPAATPPHKLDREISSDKHRLSMVELATSGNLNFKVSSRELDRGGVSYTFQTLEEITSERPEDELYFLMGADSLDDFHTWKNPERICELAIPAVVSRPDSDVIDLEKFAPFASAERLEQIKKATVDFPLIDLSSTQIRDNVRSGKSIRYMLPRPVELYISANKLYQS